MIAKFMSPMAALVLLSVSAGCSKPPKDPTKPFQGSWRVSNFGVDGPSSKTVVFDKDVCQMMEPTITNAGQVHFAVKRVDKSTIQVDATATPARIDFVYIDGEHQGKMRLGIFVFDGDTLKICVADFGAARPTDFVGAGTCTLMVLERKN